MHDVGVFLRKGPKSVMIDWIVKELLVYFGDFLVFGLRAIQLIKKLLEFVMGNKLLFIEKEFEQKFTQHILWSVPSNKEFNEFDIYLQSNFGISIERLHT
jgi:hypothetical protein